MTAPPDRLRVIAVIRALRLDAVMENLSGLPSGEVIIEQVRGYGRQKDHLGTYDAASDEGFLPKVRLEFVVTEDRLADTLEAVRSGALTGRIGDGKVFVHRLASAAEVAAS